MSDDRPDIAVVIPCRNEALTIGKVVDDFARELPEARIVVFDNGSEDATASVAADHGATVLFEPRPGKGYVIESLFDRVVADVYVLVDGDDTYPAEKVHDLLEPVLSGRAHMTVAARGLAEEGGAFRPLHVAGNRLVCRLVNWVGRARLTDIMSGYRAFGRHVVERLPVVSAGFEIETEMTIQMLYYRMRIVEVPVPYRPRPPGSRSKLRTFRDGSRVLWKVFSLFRALKPLTFFGGLGLGFLLLAVLCAIPPLHTYLTRPHMMIHSVPMVVLAVGFMVISAGFVFLGIILHAVNWRLLEMHNVLTRRPSRASGRRPERVEGRRPERVEGRR